MTASPYFLYLPKQSLAIPSADAQPPNVPGPDGRYGTTDKTMHSTATSDDQGQGGVANQQGAGKTNFAKSAKQILKTIEEMNKYGTNKTQPSIGPLPPSFQPQPMPTPINHIRPKMVMPPGNNQMIPHPQQPPAAHYQSNWFNMVAQSLTPDQKTMLSAMNPDDKRMYLVSMRRKFEQQQRIMNNPQMHHPAAAGHPINMQQYRPHLTRQMVNPGMPMNPAVSSMIIKIIIIFDAYCISLNSPA